MKVWNGRRVLELVRDKLFDAEGYVGSLNDIPVFVAPVGPGSSYLIPKEAMSTLTFTKFNDGVFVQVSSESVHGKDTLINLKLTWRFQLNLKASECWQFRYM